MKPDEFILDEWKEPGAQARAWLVRLKSGEATRDDLDALARWRAASEGNEQAYRAELHLWQAIGQAADVDDRIPAPFAQSRRGAPAIPAAHIVSRRWVLRGGAGLAAAAVGGVLLIGGGATPAGATRYETAKGERKRVRLAEGLDMELNTDSRLFYFPGERDPRMVLDRGEAMIMVAYPEGRRLLASANDVDVTASSARFVLRDRDGKTTIACLDGDLSVRSNGKAYVLEKSRTLVVDPDAPAPAKTAMVEGDTAWHNGLFVFRDRPAGDVVEELNRYRSGYVHLPASRAATRISGVIRLDRIDLAVDHIARSLDMRVVRLPGGVALLRG